MYQVDPVPGADSYSWTVPSGATIVSGQNYPAITVLWGPASGIVSVTAGNDCGNSTPSVLNVDVSTIPSDPGTIQGPDLGCTGIELSFSITDVPGAETYEWAVPPDAQITEGQGTTAIKVIWGEISGNISVIAQNFCGNSLPGQRMLVATSLPDTAGIISGKDTVCRNHTGYLFSIPQIANASSYIWTLPPGATISSGQGSNEITVDFAMDASSGNLSVYGVNDCGDGFPATLPVIVAGCTGIDSRNLNATVEIFPNPAGNVLHVLIYGKEDEINFIITDIAGEVKLSEKVINIPQKYSKDIDLNGFAEGVYFIRLFKDNRYLVEKFVVRR